MSVAGRFKFSHPIDWGTTAIVMVDIIIRFFVFQKESQTNKYEIKITAMLKFDNMIITILSRNNGQKHITKGRMTFKLI